MSENHGVLNVTPTQIWAVLADPESYPNWVVGAQAVRLVEGRWPQVGSKLHHSVGSKLATIKDNTQVLEMSPNIHLKLRARVRPIGVADITIDLATTSTGTKMTWREDVVGGPAAKFYGKIMSGLMRGRNAQSMRRLEELARSKKP